MLRSSADTSCGGVLVFGGGVGGGVNPPKRSSTSAAEVSAEPSSISSLGAGSVGSLRARGSIKGSSGAPSSLSKEELGTRVGSITAGPSEPPKRSATSASELSP